MYNFFTSYANMAIQRTKAQKPYKSVLYSTAQQMDFPRTDYGFITLTAEGFQSP